MYYLRTKAAVDAIKFTVDTKALESAANKVRLFLVLLLAKAQRSGHPRGAAAARPHSYGATRSSG
jgi:hypothetical protein